MSVLTQRIPDNGGGARSYKNNGGCVVTPPTPTYTPPVRDYSRAYERAEAYTQSKQYVSQSVQTTYNQKIEAQAAWNQHVQKQERIEQQITKYTYTKGGNTSVVTAEEAKKEAVQVYNDIRHTTKDVIEPQTKKYTTANSKTNNILNNLKNGASKFLGLFDKTHGSLEDRAKQACETGKEYRSSEEILKEIRALLDKYGYAYAQNPRMIELYQEYVIQKRYEHNKTIDQKYLNNDGIGLIGQGITMNGQARYEGYQIGTYGNMPSHGCGPISVYNALVLLGDYEDPSDIIKYFDEKTGGFGLLGTGLIGTDTQAVYDYFNDHNYSTKIIYDASDDMINKAPQEHDVVIIMYQWMIGGHYITVEYDENEGFTIYNEFNFSFSKREEIKDLLQHINSPDYESIIIKTIIMVDKK